jgi:hypothetical protein
VRNVRYILYSTEIRKNLVKGLLQEHGSQLVHALINACLFCLPTFMTADIGEVLYELMIVDRPVSNHGNRYLVPSFSTFK